MISNHHSNIKSILNGEKRKEGKPAGKRDTWEGL